MFIKIILDAHQGGIVAHVSITLSQKRRLLVQPSEPSSSCCSLACDIRNQSPTKLNRYAYFLEK